MLLTSRKEVSLFGKLPFYEDYLRHRCFNGNAGAYREWLEEGFATAARDDAEPSELGYPRRLMFFPEDRRSAVVASLKDSCDKDGVRPFPFTSYVSCRAKGVPPSPAAQVVELRPTWDATDRLTERVEAMHHVEAFLSFARDLQPLKQKGSDLPASRPTLREFAKAHAFAAEAAGEAIDAFGELLWRLKKSVEAAFAPGVPLGVRPAVRVPILDRCSTTLQAWVWLKLLEGSGLIAADRREPVTFAFPAEGHVGDLWIIARPPRPRDYGVLCLRPRGFLSYEPDGDPARNRDGFNGFRERMEEFLFARESRFEALAEFRL